MKNRSPRILAMFNSAIFDLSSASSNCCCAFLNFAKFKAAVEIERNDNLIQFGYFNV